MRNRTYGGVRGRKTKVGRKLLRFPPTRLCYPARCPLLLTILKRIYKNYKEKSSLCLLISLENMYLCRLKKSDEFSSQHGLN